MSRRGRLEPGAAQRLERKDHPGFIVGAANWAAVTAVRQLLEGGGSPPLSALLVEGPRGAGRSALLGWAAGQLPPEAIRVLPGPADSSKRGQRSLEALRTRAAGGVAAVIDDLDELVHPPGIDQAAEVLAAFAKAGGRILAAVKETCPCLSALRTAFAESMRGTAALVSLFPPTPAMLEEFILASLRDAGITLPDGLDLVQRVRAIRADFRCAVELVQELCRGSRDQQLTRAAIEESVAAVATRWGRVGDSLPIRAVQAAIEGRLGRGPASRHALAYALRSKTSLSFEAIARLAGMKTGSAAFKAVRKMAARVRLDPVGRRAVEEGLKVLAEGES